ncbi:MAG: HDOD domain-containing protein [Chromatiales bacterium]|nr:HDOD domain-containing protein [Chromatiales bacterium]
MLTAEQAKEQVLKLQHLPPLSATATRLLALLSEEDLALNKLAEAINQDPGLSARILGLANSAYFGQQNPVLRVEDAIIRVLGLNMVKSLAFSISISGAFDISGCHQFDIKQYWLESLSTAILARHLSIRSTTEVPPDPDAVYLAGLLMKIGVLVLVHLFPEDYDKVLVQKRQQGSDADLLALETEMLGINHRQAGAWLADRWHLPELVVSAIAQVNEPGESSHAKEVTLVGAVSCWLSEPEQEEQPIADCTSELSDCCGLSAETIAVVKSGFIDEEEEIKVIANLLAS